MSSKNDATKLGVLGVASLGSLCGFGAQEAQAAGDDEVQKQAARLISQAISARVGETVSLRGMMDDAHASGMWGSMAYTPLDLSVAGGSNSIDISQGIFGVDFGGSGNVVFGIVGTVSSATGELDFDTGFGTATSDFSSTSGGVGPYAALVINDNFFLSGLATYTANYSEFSMTLPIIGTTEQSSTSSSVGAEFSANVQAKMGDTVLRGKAALNTFMSIPEEGDSVTSNSLVVGGEAEQMFTSHIGGYVSAQTFYSLDSETGADQNTPIYAGAGAFVRFDANRQIGVGYQTQFGDDTIDMNTLMIQARFKF